jgi:hypothetical protein
MTHQNKRIRVFAGRARGRLERARIEVRMVRIARAR